MNLHIKPAPVRKSVQIAAPPDRAFEIFTAGIGHWWPKSHKIGPSDLDRPVIEPREGGRWYELDVDGTECEIGRVAAWEPPSRLVLIWQLTPEFTFDPDLVTEVEVLFTPDAGGTRVDLQHRHIERMGEKAEAMRETVSGPAGWPALLQLFADEIENQEKTNG